MRNETTRWSMRNTFDADKYAIAGTSEFSSINILNSLRRSQLARTVARVRLAYPSIGCDENGSSIHLSPIEQAQLPYFTYLVRNYVSTFYPETEAAYSYNLAVSQPVNHKPDSTYTFARTVWGIRLKDDIAGFFVVSEKKGKSIKLGPIVLDREYQHQGLGQQVIVILSSYYAQLGFRKLYMTVPARNVAAINFAVRSGFAVEARLKQHYSENWDELVFGRLLVIEHRDIIELSKQHFAHSSEYNPLDGFIFSSPTTSYKYRCESLTSSCEISKCETPLDDYSKKPFKVFSDRDKSKAGAVVATFPKRGGAIKLGEIKGDFRLAQGLLREAEIFYYGMGRRKIYSILSLFDREQIELLKTAGYKVEGRIIEPYGPRTDAVLLAKHRR